ncbi:MAG: aspartate kinase [Calditrichia bacterium]
MGIIVQKYGGSSLADPEKIKNVASHVVDTYRNGNSVVVVVSAMGKTTDELLRMAKQISPNPPKRELDMLLSVGERISIALLAMAIQELGVDAISFTGSQVGIITDTHHTQARILEVKGHRLQEALKEGKIAIVAGFQGVSTNKEITTLGRGGSDATAVAISAALNADECQIMKDVDGVFVANPKIVSSVKLTPELSYDEMLEMSELGAEVINHYAVEIARHYKVKISVGNTFSGSIGTIITDKSFETAKISGIVGNDKVFAVKIQKGNSSQIWDLQNAIEENRWKTYYSYLTDSTFWAVFDESCQTDICDFLQGKHWDHPPIVHDDVTLISVIGSGLNYNSPLVKDILNKIEIYDKEILSFQATIQKISIILKGKDKSRKVVNEIYEIVQ